MRIFPEFINKSVDIRFNWTASPSQCIVVDLMADVSLNSCFHAVIESWSFCFRVQKSSLMLSGKIMHCEEPKSRGPAASKLLTHFSKPEPNGHTRPRNFILTGRKAPDAVDLCAPWGSSRNVRFCIYQRQHPTSLLSSTERGLSSNANRLIFKGVRGGPPPLLKTQHGICVRPLSEREAKRARSCFVRSQWIRLL